MNERLELFGGLGLIDCAGRSFNTPRKAIKIAAVLKNSAKPKVTKIYSGYIKIGIEGIENRVVNIFNKTIGKNILPKSANTIDPKMEAHHP